MVAEGTKVIWDGAFKNCVSLTNITFPNGLEEIRSDVFKNCTALGEVAIPDSVRRIDNGAFEGCRELSGVVKIPGGCRYVAGSVFLGCALKCDRSAVAKKLALANLCPEVIKAVFSGTAPESLNLSKVMRGFPDDWGEQKRLFGLE